jgi:hypothetical protein
MTRRSRTQIELGRVAQSCEKMRNVGATIGPGARAATLRRVIPKTRVAKGRPPAPGPHGVVLHGRDVCVATKTGRNPLHVSGRVVFLMRSRSDGHEIRTTFRTLPRRFSPYLRMHGAGVSHGFTSRVPHGLRRRYNTIGSARPSAIGSLPKSRPAPALEVDTHASRRQKVRVHSFRRARGRMRMISCCLSQPISLGALPWQSPPLAR